MNKEDWESVARHLTWPGAQARLQCDQFMVTLQVQRDKMRMYIAVYVDGWMKGEWMTTDCEERRRFLRPITHRPKPHTKHQLKLLGKKWCDDQRVKYTRTYYTPFWPSAKALRRHFEKYNISVARTEIDASANAVEGV